MKIIKRKGSVVSRSIKRQCDRALQLTPIVIIDFKRDFVLYSFFARGEEVGPIRILLESGLAIDVAAIVSAVLWPLVTLGLVLSVILRHREAIDSRIRSIRRGPLGMKFGDPIELLRPTIEHDASQDSGASLSTNLEVNEDLSDISQRDSDKLDSQYAYHAYWLGHDVMFTQYTVSNIALGSYWPVEGMKRAQGHIEAMGLKDSVPAQTLNQLIRNAPYPSSITSDDYWTLERRDQIAAILQQLKFELATLV